MKSTTLGILGLLLITAGVLVFVYKGLTYTEHEEIAQIGNITVAADTQKRVYFHPILGGLAIAAGLVLVVVSRRRK